MESLAPGDIVLTFYGVGVLTRCPTQSVEAQETKEEEKNDNTFVVRLWRNPNHSIGSSSEAFLDSSAIIKTLPAAPGMVSFAKVGGDRQKVMVYCYYSSRDSYLVKVVQKDGGHGTDFVELYPEDIETAPGAKFYPLLEELMTRGDAAAAATTALLHDEKVTRVVKQSTKMLESQTEGLKSKSKEGVDKLKNTVSETLALAEDSDTKQVYNMLKDEELTVLLKKGRERLQSLMKTDVSSATKAALRRTGIVIADNDDEASTFRETIVKSRDVALSSLEQLLKDAEVDPGDLHVIRGKLEDNFSTMFDSLAEAAKSDRTLGTIFDTISGKTSAWQEATGRLLSTRSGSLFMEGASRLQARAADLFSSSDFGWAGQVGSKLTKAFTEGDAAVARLKSIELGDAVRSRLVSAIEVRSGSQGGLDGIIAGALTTVTKSGDKMQSMLTNLEGSASSATKDAHETLISVISRQSEYRDVALLRIEEVLCNLDAYLGDELSPQEIAALSGGDGGTAALFQPIAKRASKEISKHLDHAESSIADPTIVAALQSVRKIVSGELSMAGLMDEAVSILNDENVVAAGETIVKHGEIALDAIEGISGNKIAGDVMKVAEKAGITKESVMSQIESLNVNDLLDTAGSAVTDEKARRELVSSATDTALDFVLRILPSMPVPPYDGVRDGLMYHLSNLSMEGFKVRKEDIAVEIAGMRATKNSGPMLELPEETREKTPDEIYETVIENNELKFIKKEEDPQAVKAAELLIIDVRGISAILDDAFWRFEQTYMPYLKGSGKANVKLRDGSIRLQFELRKRKKEANEDAEDENADSQWEPVLCLHDRRCTIGQVELVLQGEGSLTWVVNKLAALLKGPLRDYVVRTILNVLTNKSGYILEQLNTNLAPYWSLIMRTTGLSLDDLVEADREVIMTSQSDEDDHLIELVWRENLPLGMNLLLNDDSGKLKVVDFPRGSQARQVCNDKEIDAEVFKGATIVAVNGTRYDLQEDLFGALKNPSRPKSILFELANPEDAERVARFVDGAKKGKKKAKDLKNQSTERIFFTRDVVVKENVEIGLEFTATKDGFGLSVRDFVPGDGGTVLAAERDGTIKMDDLLTHVNGKLVVSAGGDGQRLALETLEREGNNRPCTLSFTDAYLISQHFEKSKDGISELGGPTEFVLEEKNKRILLTDFENVPGAAEEGGILIGDHLVFINGIPVGAGCSLSGGGTAPELSEVYRMLRDENNYPIALTFARPKQSENRWAAQSAGRFSVNAAETHCIAADSYDQLGSVVEGRNGTEVVVTDLFAVPGPFQKAMRPFLDVGGKVCLTIEEINGQFVPSYATPSIVMNAMKRSWAGNKKLELLFCDDERKRWVHNLK